MTRRHRHRARPPVAAPAAPPRAPNAAGCAEPAVVPLRRAVAWAGAALAALAMTEPRAAAQTPVATAELRFDIDGDGAADAIRVEASGLVTLQRSGAPGAGAVRAFRATDLPLRRATLSARRYGRRAVILAQAEFGPRRAPRPAAAEALVLAYDRGDLVVLAHEAVGPQGRDGEWSRDVALTPAGVVRYQSRPGIARCDGAPAYLYAELFDFDRRAFRRATLPVQLPAGTPIAAARVGAPPAGRPIAFRFDAVSRDARAAGAADLAPPRELADGDPATAWTGFSRGDFATARQRTDHPVAGVRVVARGVRELGLVLGDRTLRVRLHPRAAEQWIELSPPVRARCATAVITAADRDAAIAELHVLTDLELSADGGARALAEQVARGDRAVDAVDQLARLGAAALDALTAAARAAPTDEAAARARTAIAVLVARGVAPGAGALDELIAGCARARAGTAALSTCRRALRAAGPAGVAAARRIAADRGARPAARTAALDVLAAADGAEALDALAALAGTGTPRWRAAVAAALAARPAEDLAAIVAAADGADTPAREADLWRAAGGLARRAPDPAVAVDAMRRRLATARDYEVRYRLIGALAAIDADAAREAAAAALTDRTGGARGAALRRVAVAGLGRNPSPAAAALLARALADPDPGVRIRAVGALAERADLPAAASAGLVRVLRTDRWPRARRGAAGALAGLCGQRAAADALAGAAGADPDAGVQTAALASLFACRDPRAADLALAIARDRGRDPHVRARAVALAAAAGGPVCEPLLSAFRTIRGQAWDDSRAVRVAAAALAAAVDACGARAVPAVEQAAVDDAFPAVQAAAIEGLGRLCPPGAARLLGRAANLDDRAVAAAARRGLARCRRPAGGR